MAETLDRAALAEAHRLLDVALATDCPWYEHANASARLSAWLTERAWSLLALAERIAAIDPALLDRLAERYAAGPVHCLRCRRAMVGVLTVTDDRVRHWHCPSERETWHGLTGGRVTPLPDDDVLALVAAIRGEAVPDAS